MEIVFGTHRLTPSNIPVAITTALDMGYTRIDTARSYRIEEHVGTAVRNWISADAAPETPNGADGEDIVGPPRRRRTRRDVHITSKLPPKAMSSDLAHATGLASLESIFPASSTPAEDRYLDGYLIHWPAASGLAPSDPRHATARREAWSALLRLRGEGLVRESGVSNFTPAHLAALLAPLPRSERPAANQIEVHPGCWRSQLPCVEFCRGAGIEVQAYSAVGCGELVRHPRVVELAGRVRARVEAAREEHEPRAPDRHPVEITPAQVLLKWSMQHGMLPVAKSADPARIRENLGARSEEWALEPDEMGFLDGFQEREGGGKMCWDPSHLNRFHPSSGRISRPDGIDRPAGDAFVLWRVSRSQFVPIGQRPCAGNPGAPRLPALLDPRLAPRTARNRASAKLPARSRPAGRGMHLPRAAARPAALLALCLLLPRAAARYAPAYFGMHLDHFYTGEITNGDNPWKFAERFGRHAAIYADYLDLCKPSGPEECEPWWHIQRFGGEVLRVSQEFGTGGNAPCYSLAVLPWNGLGMWYPGSPYLNRLRDELAVLQGWGLRCILVRFAIEANGHWFPFGQQPDEFKRAFRAVAETLRPMGIRMIWSMSHFNCQGRGDYDPYEPYWPGGDIVDIVGLDVYPGGFQDSNTIIPDGELERWITGYYGEFWRCNFYQRWVVETNKPFHITETGAGYNIFNSWTGDEYTAVKRSWFANVFSTLWNYDRLVGVTWFEYVKQEDGAHRDFTFSFNPSTRDIFKSMIPWDQFCFADNAQQWEYPAIGPRPY
ncbi:NADP-dependent oxidoreductase domain-containing protein [Hyaloraphidium curvatum]|nr:NADP-dependent oxidoreductase domain-containing protein [Hyaloraphidium curvatum]